MDKNSKQILVILTIIAAFMLALAFTLIDSSKADAAQPYGGCAEAWQAPTSTGADDCREAGWLVNKGYVVSPRKVLRFYDLDSCRYEDGSGQRQACGWNVVDGDGNGHGKVYLALPRAAGQDDRIVYLNVCSHHRCQAWVR